jgi:hypothetical protein
MSTTKVYDKENVYQCCVVKHSQGYEVVFPPEETLKSLHKNTMLEVTIWLDQNFGVLGWVLK